MRRDTLITSSDEHAALCLLSANRTRFGRAVGRAVMASELSCDIHYAGYHHVHAFLAQWAEILRLEEQKAPTSDVCTEYLYSPSKSKIEP